MLMHTREGTTIVTQQEKLKTKLDNRLTIYFKGFAMFDPFCCRESVISYLQWAVFIFALDKPSWAKPTFTRYISLKVRHFPGKVDNKPLPGVFLEASFRYNRRSKQYFIRFLYGAGPLVTSSLAWLLRSLKSSLRSLTNSWNSIPR